ncbi:MAG: restriction endonuclease, partial [Gammaproteobacteria bacterium]
LGADFLMLFECKRHASPVEREDVQILKDKLRSSGAHKGVIVAASGFQKGALQYAEIHKIACVRLVDGAWTYETRGRNAPMPRLTGRYVAFARYLTDGGYGNVLLSGEPEHLQNMLLESSIY